MRTSIEFCGVNMEVVGSYSQGAVPVLSGDPYSCTPGEPAGFYLDEIFIGGENVTGLLEDQIADIEEAVTRDLEEQRRGCA